ncbi:MAG: hypothetical protein L6Q37_11750, partial [Bdellovibrionaceae bacterium]|nr:hypothetical protein [Pseudobdellovibrionaceae bacterium]
MTKGIKSFFFIYIFSSTLFSRECLDKDLRKFFTERHEQKSQNWCYAYTAADLINFQFQQTLIGKKISPLHIALLNLANDQLPYNSNDGGDVKDGVSLALAPY